jgi:hypothetical protein
MADGTRPFNMPAPGTFLSPGDAYSYALQVVSVHASDNGLPRAVCIRWGKKDGRPFNDGHLGRDHVVQLRYRGPGAWTSPAWYPDSDYGLILWRVVPAPDGQMGLFA